MKFLRSQWLLISLAFLTAQGLFGPLGVRLGLARDVPYLNPVNQPAPSPQDLANAEAVNHSALCGTEPCPEALALFSASAETDDGSWIAYRCTGFLASNRIFVTNSHCIPRDLKRALSVPGATDYNDCRGRIMVHFPAHNEKPVRHVACGRITYASNQQVGRAQGDTIPGRSMRPEGDYAFIELAETVNDREPLQFDFDSIVRDSRGQQPVPLLHLPYFDATNGNTSILREKRCEASVGNFFIGSRYGANVSATSVIRSLRNCALPPGSSGAPVLNDAGRVVGIHFAAIAPHLQSFFRETTEESSAIFERWFLGLSLLNIHMPPIGEMEPVSFFTAARCLRQTPAGETRSVSVSCIRRDVDEERTEAQAQVRIAEEAHLASGPPQANFLDDPDSSVLTQNEAQIRQGFLQKFLRDELLKENAQLASLRNWSMRHSEVFHWGFREVLIPGQTILVYPAPVCVKPVSGWQLSFRNQFRSGPGEIADAHFSQLASLPVYELRLSVNAQWIYDGRLTNFYTANPNLDQGFRSSTILAFSPRQIAQAGGRGVVRMNSLMTVLSPPNQALEQYAESTTLLRSEIPDLLNSIIFADTQDIHRRTREIYASFSSQGVFDENSQAAFALRFAASRPFFEENLLPCSPAQLSNPAEVQVLELRPHN